MIFQDNIVQNFTLTGILPPKQEKTGTISKKTGTMSKNRKKQEFGQKTGMRRSPEAFIDFIYIKLDQV